MSIRSLLYAGTDKRLVVVDGARALVGLGLAVSVRYVGDTTAGELLVRGFLDLDTLDRAGEFGWFVVRPCLQFHMCSVSQGFDEAYRVP